MDHGLLFFVFAGRFPKLDKMSLSAMMFSDMQRSLYPNRFTSLATESSRLANALSSLYMPYLEMAAFTCPHASSAVIPLTPLVLHVFLISQ